MESGLEECIKLSIVSDSDSHGGAARAAFRLHESFLEKDIVKSNMIVSRKNTDRESVIIKGGLLFKLNYVLKKKLSQKLLKLQITKNNILHSLNLFGNDNLSIINSKNYDIVNLHWVNGDTLSIKEISLIRAPIVMTLHDMWAFCGAEHYVADDENARFRLGYSSKNRLPGEHGLDINRYIWNLKKKHWAKLKNLTIVTPSEWLSSCVKESELLKHLDVRTIPNALNIDIFKPLDCKIARDILRLPQDKILIGFGALGGGKDSRKGFDLLKRAIEILAESEPNKYHCVIIGQSEATISLPMPASYLGHLSDDQSISLFYNSLDVMVVPSKQENLPQTATESIATGTPVVAFDCTGFPDAIKHKYSGYLAKPYCEEDLSFGIKWCINNRKVLEKNARDIAVNNWSYEEVSKLYKELFEEILKKERL
ncbi:TPA: glycosyltransferase [Vibrio parahaemolyticus]